MFKPAVVFLGLFLFITSFTLAQTKSKKEFLQGTWMKSDADTVFKYKFDGDKLYVLKGNTVLCESPYELKRKKIIANCFDKDRLIFRCKSITDSVLVMKSAGYSFDHYYCTYVKIKK